MTGFDRLKASLQNKEPDNIPFDLGVPMVSGINVNALAELKKYLGLESPAEVKDTITKMSHTGDDVIEYLKENVNNVSPRVPTGSQLKDIGIHNGCHLVEDEWGILCESYMILKKDLKEMINQYSNPDYVEIVKELTQLLLKTREEIGDTDD